MSESLTDLLATDAELDMIAARQGGSHDHVLAELALLAAAVDETPLPPVIRTGCRPAMSSTRKGGWALSITVALMVTSSGVAAAVSENPLAPLHYMTTQMWKMSPHDGGKVPGWDINGSMPISTVPAVRIPGASAPPAASGSTAGSGTGDDSTSAGSSGARRSHSGVVLGYGKTHSQGSGHGGRSGHPPGRSGGGQDHDPTNVGEAPGTGAGGPTGPGNPGVPGKPIRPGHGNGPGGGQPTHAGSGQVPGTGTGGGPTGGQQGTPPCRIDIPQIPGASRWTEGPGLRPCRTHPAQPGQPGTTQRPKSQQPKATQKPPASAISPPTSVVTPPTSTDATPTSTATTPTLKPEIWRAPGSLR